MPNGVPVIGEIIASPNDKYKEGNVNKYDQILMGQTFDEGTYPELFSKLGTNILDSMTSLSASAPYRIVADLT